MAMVLCGEGGDRIAMVLHWGCNNGFRWERVEGWCIPCGESKRMVSLVGKVEEWFSVWGRWKNGFPCGEGGRMVFRVGKVEEWFSV